MSDAVRKSWEGMLVSRKFVSKEYKDRPVFIDVESLGYKRVTEYRDDMFRMVLYSKDGIDILEIYEL
jgi:hypothetical protein